MSRWISSSVARMLMFESRVDALLKPICRRPGRGLMSASGFLVLLHVAFDHEKGKGTKTNFLVKVELKSVQSPT
jgi:hypothetical protein